QQISEVDKYTIQHEPILSIDLMERASQKCVDWILKKFDAKNTFAIFCGVGNNGGDGLAIARLLLDKKYKVKVYVVEFSKNYSADFSVNLERLKKLKAEIEVLTETNNQFAISKECIVVDAIFGSGLNKPINGFVSAVI